MGRSKPGKHVNTSALFAPAILTPRIPPVSSARGSWWADASADRDRFASMVDQERPRMCANVTYLKVPLRIVGLIEGGPFEGDPK